MILDRIVEAKRTELVLSKQKAPLRRLIDQIPEGGVVSFSRAIERPGVNIIAEIKYASPSHGPFQCQLSPQEIAQSYAQNGAVALSVLTDEAFFNGSLEHLKIAFEVFVRRRQVEDSEEPEPPGHVPSGVERAALPLLRKDFIVDPYQIAEARVAGASAYLLIVACLDVRSLGELLGYGTEMGLEALVEIHHPSELETAVESGACILGVNNRNLRTFEVDVKTSFDIARRLEGETRYLLVAESGLSEPSQIHELRDAGFDAFLIGSAFMDAPDPGRKLRRLLDSV